MVGLLGTGDELLHVIEREFSGDVHVRGNEVTVTGPAAETELVGRLFAELLELQRKGAELSPDTVERTLGMLRGVAGRTRACARRTCWPRASCPRAARPSAPRR